MKGHAQDERSNAVPEIGQGTDTPQPAITADLVASGGLSWSTWLGKGGWALADQVLFAGANFLLHILLARWLAPDDYGAFTLAYSMLFLASAFHSALLTEPMVVFGASKYEGDFPRYLGFILQDHAVLSITMGAIFFASGLLLAWLGVSQGARALFALAPSVPLVLLFWLLRRALYVRVQPHWGATGSLVYFVVLLGTAWTAHAKGWLAAPGALTLMGVSSLTGSIWMFFLLRPQWTPSARPAWTRAMRRECWQYGRWAIGVGLVMWCTNNVHYLVLPWSQGFDQVAGFRALFNLLSPFQHVTLALGSLLLPVMARQSKAVGSGGLKLFAGRFLLAAAPVGFVYALVIAAFHGPLLDALYGGKYEQYGHLLWLGVPLPVLWVTLSSLSNALRAMNRPDNIFRAYLLSCAVVLTVSVPLTILLGISGSLAGWSASLATTAVFMTLSLWAVPNSR